MAQLTLSDYKNNLFSNHFLEERIQDREEWEETDFEEKLEELKKIYEKNKEFLTENLNEDQTQQKFIDPVLNKLGHEWTPEARRRVGSRTDGKELNPDYAFLGFEQQLEISDDEEKDYFDGAYAIGDAKAWNKTLDKSTQDHTNPAFQIYNYVDRLRADWGILTNGKKWRLYSYEDCAADIYFEIDLEDLLVGEKTDEKLEAFKYFYLLFRAESFENSFLEEIYRESVNFAEGLEDDLEDKVYNALEVAVEGFFETNDIEKTEENIDLVHHASLIFLYRVLFILNAESRDLLPTEYEAYKQAFGLTQLKRMIIEDEVDDPLFQETTVAWDNRISRLFEGIDDGYDLNETEIPAYNGGLFDEENGETNKVLAENKLYGSYIKEILELLATSYDEEKEKRIILDYKDLNIRHLGSVYEGLLEHKFKAADERKILKNEEWQNFSESSKDWEEIEDEKKVEENELYLTNESGERKATGSYYTPEYIVEYIVENTVGPKVEEKIEEAEENNENILPKILELNVCDPAMGSGHFLTEATQYIAEHIVEHANLEDQEIDENEDELNWAKRQVVQNCIYGVDINELAVELGKLSLWIETMAEGKPLNFLDHHLKHGNSLIGSDFDEIFSHPTEDQKRLNSERYQFGDPQEIKENFQEQYLEIEQMPENTVEQIHEKEQAYKKFISNNTLYQQFQQLANIHTRQHFTKEANSSDYESFLINIGNPSNPFKNEEWFKASQTDAENRNYFHWQLEFPKVFFGETQGFDAVVGNPPYVSVSEIPSDQKDYILSDVYETTQRRVDLYVAFIEKGFSLNALGGQLSYIIPQPFLSQTYAEELRKYLLDYDIPEIVDLSDYEIFEDAEVDNIILSIRASNDSDEVLAIEQKEDPNITETIEGTEKKISKADFRKMFNTMYRLELNPSLLELKESIDSNSFRLGEGMAAKWGARGSPISDFHFEEKINENCEKMIKGSDVHRFYSNYRDRWLLYDYDELYRPAFPELFENPKLMVSKVTGEEGLRVAVDSNHYYTDDSVCNCVKKTALEDKSDAFLNRRKISISDEGLDLISDYDLRYIAGILSSRLLNFYFRNLVGYDLNVYPDSVQYLPIYQNPEEEKAREIISKYEKGEEKQAEFFDEVNSFFDWLESSWDLEIEDMSLKNSIKEYWEYDFDEFMRVAKKNKSSIDGSVKSREFRELMKSEWESSMDTLRPLMQEINELENEIDAIVFDLYDLTEEEVETVLDSLDTEEDDKSAIIQEFQNIKS